MVGLASQAGLGRGVVNFRVSKATPSLAHTRIVVIFILTLTSQPSYYQRATPYAARKVCTTYSSNALNGERMQFTAQHRTWNTCKPWQRRFVVRFVCVMDEGDVCQPCLFRINACMRFHKTSDTTAVPHQPAGGTTKINRVQSSYRLTTAVRCVEGHGNCGQVLPQFWTRDRT